MQNSKCKIKNWSLLFFIFNFSFFIASCSLPNLESNDCTQARDLVKKFYSFHFGNEMRLSPETLKAREKFLTPELYRSLSSLPESNTDYFTASDELPRTF